MSFFVLRNVPAFLANLFPHCGIVLEAVTVLLYFRFYILIYVCDCRCLSDGIDILFCLMCVLCIVTSFMGFEPAFNK